MSKPHPKWSAGRTGRLAAMMAGCALLAAACGSSSSSTGASATASSSAGSGAGHSSKHVSIGVAETFTAIPFFQGVAQGASAAGVQDGNATVKVVGPAQSTGTAEATMAANLEQSAQPDGFAPNPCVLPAWTTTLASLEREVPNGNVIAWDCSPIASPSQTSPIKTFVGATPVDEGYQTALVSIKAAHLSPSTTGTALIANCDKAVPLITASAVGLVDGVKRMLPKVKIVQFASGLDQASDTAAWTSEFGNTSHVVYAAGPCDDDAASLALLKQRHVGGDFVAGDNDVDSPALLKDIESGLLAGGVSAAPWVEGNVTVHMLIDAARGAKRPIGWINTGVYPVTKANAARWLKATSSTAAEQAFFAPIAQRILTHLPALTKPLAQSASLTPSSGA
jgi:ABC-type sugar transport system substrate-binding protein